MSKNKEAHQAFLKKIAIVEAQLKRLEGFVIQDRMGITPNDINWADVGSLSHVEDSLKAINNFVFCEGEG